jgi:hypothetical protein
MRPADDHPARAVLLTIDWDHQEVTWSFFEGEDAGIRAEGLKMGIEGDFEGATYLVWAEGPARTKLGDWRIAPLFGNPT